MKGVKLYPFAEHMSAAMGVVGWVPEVFWQATPRELWLALNGNAEYRGAGARAPISKQRLKELMKAHPDRAAVDDGV